MKPSSKAHAAHFSRRRWLQGATAAAVGAPLMDLLPGAAHAQARMPLPEIEAVLPGFSVAERDRRWAAVRKNMGAPQWNLDAIITCFSDEWGSDARYLTQVEKVRYSGGGPQVIFPRDPAKTVWVQMGGARHRDEWIGRLNDGGKWLADGKMQLLAEEGGADMAERLAAEGFDRRGTRIGVSALEGSRFETDGLVSATWMDILRKRLPGVEFLGIDHWGPDCGPIISAVMAKSAEEAAMIRHAVASNQAGLQALVDAVANGATRQDEAWWAAFATMFAANGEDFNRLSIGFDEGGNMTLGEPTVDPIRTGQLCTQEISSSYQGYACQINHTFFVGGPSTPGYDYYRAAIEVLGDIHERGMAFIKPGTTTYGQLMEKLADLYREHDVDGGGVALHSGGIGRVRPRLGSSPDNEIVIAPGHTFDWKPSVALSRAKVRDAREENREVQLGESYLVTDTGVERFGDRSLGPIATHA
jgi:Xaa-Pro aminopeptidase